MEPEVVVKNSKLFHNGHYLKINSNFYDDIIVDFQNLKYIPYNLHVFGNFIANCNLIEKIENLYVNGYCNLSLSTLKYIKGKNIFNEDVDFSENPLLSIKGIFKSKGTVNLWGCNLLNELPDIFIVEGNLILTNTSIKLPPTAEIGGKVIKIKKGNLRKNSYKDYL